jgi:hypothetical protein
MNQLLRSFSTRISRFTIVITLIVICFGCEKNIPFEESKVVPAAQGNVAIKKDNNNNYAISITISDLAEVKRLQPVKNVYLVWVETEDHSFQNIGQIDSDKGFISSKLKAKFETVTSHKPIKIFITAEDDQNVEQPAKQIILTTKNF